MNEKEKRKITLNSWHNTDAELAAEMLEVSDKLCREMSSGEVSKLEDYEADNNTSDLCANDGTLTDEKIFGSLTWFDNPETDRPVTMGHIELTIPVVNIQYLRGRRPVLPGLLSMDRTALESIVYFGSHVVIDPGDSGFERFQIITDKERTEALQNGKFFVVQSGAGAVQKMLEAKGIPGREYMVLNCLPVLPVLVRYQYKPAVPEKHYPSVYMPNGLNALYARTILRNNRLKKLISMDAPEIILRNESRMLQEYADSLISNGARGLPVSDGFGYAYGSMNEFYEKIRGKIYMRAEVETPETHIDPAMLAKTAKEYAAAYLECQHDDQNYGVEESEKALDKKEQIRALLYPYFLAFMKLNYNRYIRFEQDIFSYIFAILPNKLQAIYNSTDRDIPDETTRDCVEATIMHNTDLFIKKQIQWLSSNAKGEKERDE